MKVLITGSTGFLGRYVVSRLEKDGHFLALQGGFRRPAPDGPNRQVFQTGPFETFDDWPRLLEGVDIVVNLVGRSRTSRETAEAYRSANEIAMRRLVNAMERCGIPRLLHVSSVAAKVMADNYGRTKRTGEKIVSDWAEQGGRSAVILRPPLIYGPGAPGNMARLVRLVRTGLPLPFASVRNGRSLLAAANAADAIAAALARAPVRGSRIYELCDDQIVSLPEIVGAIADGLGRKIRLVPFPPSLLYKAASLKSRQMAEGLFGDLTLDRKVFKEDFDWQPSVQTLEGLREMARAMHR